MLCIKLKLMWSLFFSLVWNSRQWHCMSRCRTRHVISPFAFTPAWHRQVQFSDETPRGSSESKCPSRAKMRFTFCSALKWRLRSLKTTISQSRDQCHSTRSPCFCIKTPHKRLSLKWEVYWCTVMRITRNDSIIWTAMELDYNSHRLILYIAII